MGRNGSPNGEAYGFKTFSFIQLNSMQQTVDATDGAAISIKSKRNETNIYGFQRENYGFRSLSFEMQECELICAQRSVACYRRLNLTLCVWRASGCTCCPAIIPVRSEVACVSHSLTATPVAHVMQINSDWLECFIRMFYLFFISSCIISTRIYI